MTFNPPSESNSLGAAVGWLDHALLGSIATTVAVIAVAWIGFLMLTGRIEVRRAVQVIFGCFILFGASTIAQAIIAGANDLSPMAPPPDYQATAPPPHPPPPPSNYDPYAGAAVMPRQ